MQIVHFPGKERPDIASDLVEAFCGRFENYLFMKDGALNAYADACVTTNMLKYPVTCPECIRLLEKIESETVYPFVTTNGMLLHNLGVALIILGPLKRGFRNTPGREWLESGNDGFGVPHWWRSVDAPDVERVMNGGGGFKPLRALHNGSCLNDTVSYVHPRDRKDPVDDPLGEDVAE